MRIDGGAHTGETVNEIVVRWLVRFEPKDGGTNEPQQPGVGFDLVLGDPDG